MRLDIKEMTEIVKRELWINAVIIFYLKECRTVPCQITRCLWHLKVSAFALDLFSDPNNYRS